VLELEPFSLFTSNRTELVVDDNKMPAMTTGHRLLLFSFYFNLILFFIPAKQIQVFRCLSTSGRPFVFENVFFLPSAHDQEIQEIARFFIRE
jgi:hypothetical protein